MEKVRSKKWLWLPLIILVIVAVLLPVSVWALAPAWHSAQLIEANAGQRGWPPQVAMSGLNAVAVWRQHDGTSYRIYSNRSTDGGVTWGAAQLIEANAGQRGYEPQVAMSGLNAVAVWSQYDDTADRIYSNYGAFPAVLTYTAGADGSITAPATSPTTYNSGDVVTITAVPNPGYHFVNWTGDVSTVADANLASTTITMNESYAITANFAIDTTYTLTYTAVAGGSITAPATSPSIHSSGAVVTITAAANPGYHFVNWTGDVSTVASTTSADTTITMNGNYTITANFANTVAYRMLPVGVSWR